MLDGQGLPSIQDVAEVEKGAANLLDKGSLAARRIFPAFFAGRDRKASQFRTESFIENVEKIQMSNLDEGTKRIACSVLSAELCHFENVQAIVSLAIDKGLIDEEAGTENIDDEWVENFYDHAKKVSDPEVQLLWARILAGEIGGSGSFSKRAMRFLADMSKEEARAFKKICSLSFFVSSDDGIPTPYYSYELVDSMGTGACGFELKLLFDVGLLAQNLGTYAQECYISLEEKTRFLTFSSGCIETFGKNIHVVVSEFTQIGSELMRLCDVGSASGLLDAAVNKLEGCRIEFSDFLEGDA